ncbi:MAG: putative toxin-antitoxin system toxin component, PIN family [Bacteroidaceae bacterium]|nr:putative toxin-antitoxin system toxin component, PIN family [Bacteroidaceae bacterium]
MKIVLDTNSLLQCVFPEAYHKEVWEAFLGEKYTLCLTTEIVLEYREIIERRTGDARLADDIIDLILSLPNVEHVAPAYRFNLIKADPDDNKFVDCAITAGATYIVSNDRHFAELEQYDFPKVDVRTLTEFLQIVRTL